MRRPELKLEQAADIMTEVEKLLIANKLDDADLLVAVKMKSTRIELNKADKLVSLLRHRSVILSLEEHCKEQGNDDDDNEGAKCGPAMTSLTAPKESVSSLTSVW